MNMVGANLASGGPVGGGMMMMPNGNHPPASSGGSSSHSDLKRRLDTYIYDYFLKNGRHEHARALYRDETIELNTGAYPKPSPGRRRDGEMNGMDENGIDTESKGDFHKIPDDLPKPDVPDNAQGGFLYDWFGMFLDIYGASHNKKPDEATMAAQYLHQTQVMQRMRETQHNSNIMGRQGAMPNRQFAQSNMRNGMTQEMQRALASSKMSPAQFQQLQQQHKQQMMQQMQREQSENDMNGHRPQSPVSTENAGSPSKRPRLDGQHFGGGPMAPNGRGQPGPQQQQAMNMLVANGMNGRTLSQSQFQAFQAQNSAMQKNMQQVVTMPNGMMTPGTMPGQGSPMLGPVEGQSFVSSMGLDPMYSNNPQQHHQMAALRQQVSINGANVPGHGALQDYQLQLMLLEQQNKKRLMLARQEQDGPRSDGGPPMSSGMGQGPVPPPGMSPGSRAGASPAPNEQIKRGSSQLGTNGMPASPSAGDAMPSARESPAGMGFTNGMPQDYNNQMLMKNMGEGMVGPGGPGMRPPTSMNAAGMNMDALARQGGRMPSGNWQQGNVQGQAMMQQSPQGQQGQGMGTPQGRAGEMPPPSAPATGNGPNQRNQPPSPQPGQAPPTPSQGNKAIPKGKKEKGEAKKRANKKNTATANTPAAASEAEPPATPTTSAPITPGNQGGFAKGSNAPAASGSVATSIPTPSSNAGGPPQQVPALDPAAGAGAFGDFGASGEAFQNLDFSALDTGDSLETIDFASFLNNAEDSNNGFSFDSGMNFSEGLEAVGLE